MPLLQLTTNTMGCVSLAAWYLQAQRGAPRTLLPREGLDGHRTGVAAENNLRSDGHVLSQSK